MACFFKIIPPSDLLNDGRRIDRPFNVIETVVSFTRFQSKRLATPPQGEYSLLKSLIRCYVRGPQGEVARGYGGDRRWIRGDISHPKRYVAANKNHPCDVASHIAMD
jgi:hypothetical protein